MDLSEQQKQAYSNIKNWYKNERRPFFVLAGYAGTGKSTLAGIIANEIGGDKTVFCAYTGKAAKVLQSKGCETSGTIHSFLYQFIKKGDDDEPVFTYAPTQAITDCELIVVDEYSMLDEKIFTDLIATNKKILFLGDPFQLPPVSDNTVKLSPDFFLTEVHRQSNESPILKAATIVRTGGALSSCNWVTESGEQFRYCQKGDLSFDEYKAADQNIVGRNNTRSNFNTNFRAKLGFNGGLKSKEKIICRQNNRNYGLLNGMIGTCTRCDGYMMDFECDGEKFYNLRYWRGAFDDSGSRYVFNRELQKFEWAYAITCHLSQGSEFNNIVIFNEPIGANDEERRRWLYTAITRGKKSVTLVV